MFIFFFFFNDTATTEIYTLSLHDALPICAGRREVVAQRRDPAVPEPEDLHQRHRGPRAVVVRQHGVDLADEHVRDRKSTRLNSSHANISYAVFCLKKKKKTNTTVHCIPAH